MENSYVIERLGPGSPARKIGNSYVSVTGSVATRFGYSVQFESQLEESHILCFDSNPAVCAIQVQPLILSYVGVDRKIHTYCPDLLIHYDSIGDALNPPPSDLCEVKYRDQLISDKAEILPKIIAAHEFAKERGMRFRILTESHINPQYLSNIKFLRRFRNEPRNKDMEAMLERSIRTLGQGTPEILLTATFRTESSRMEAICSLWHLILNRTIRIDLLLPLNMHSRIWPSA